MSILDSKTGKPFCCRRWSKAAISKRNDWIIAQALLKEAKALIERPSAPVAESSVPK